MASTCCGNEALCESCGRDSASKAKWSTVRCTAGTEASCVTDHPRTFPRSGLFDAQGPVALWLVFHILANRWHSRKLHNGGAGPFPVWMVLEKADD